MKEISAFLQGAARNKYAILVFALGLLLLLLPRAGTKTPSTQAVTEGAALPLDASGIPMDTEELRLAETLSQVENVGQTKVLLSMEGAIVVCDGANDPAVRLEVTDTVSIYTGLGYDRIHVVKMRGP